jgi:hypothetical protein
MESTTSSKLDRPTHASIRPQAIRLLQQSFIQGLGEALAKAAVLCVVILMAMALPGPGWAHTSRALSPRVRKFPVGHHIGNAR